MRVEGFDNLRELEPRRSSITSILSEQGAMLEELLGVATLVFPNTARRDAYHQIVEQNVLNRTSLASRKKVFAKLAKRYFREEAPATSAQFVRAMQASDRQDTILLVAYVMLAWNDALTLILGNVWLAAKLQEPGFMATTKDIEKALETLVSEFPQIRSWEAVTRNRVAQHYLGMLRDCGYATGAKRKVFRRPYIPPEVVLFAVELIIRSGEPPAGLLEHKLFTAMGLAFTEVVDALVGLNARGKIRFALQGGVINLELLGN